MDVALFHLINERWTHPALDLFMGAISDSAIWRPFLILAALLVLVFAKFRGRACILTLAVLLLLGELFTNTLKSAFDRGRPKQVMRVRMVELARVQPAVMKLFHPVAIRYSDESDRHRSGPSFPSGHTMNNTIIAMCLTLFYPRRGWLYWPVAFAIGWSRIYLGAHWPSDVAATLFLAVGVTLVFLGLFELLWRALVPRWWPDFYQRHPRLLPHSPL